MGASDIHQHLNQFVDLSVYGSVDRLLEALSPRRGDHNLSQVSARPQKLRISSKGKGTRLFRYDLLVSMLH